MYEIGVAVALIGAITSIYWLMLSMEEWGKARRAG
jgi:hypothetical protein